MTIIVPGTLSSGGGSQSLTAAVTSQATVIKIIKKILPLYG